MSKPKLLIIDDDPLISDSLSFVLGDAFQITTASSRREAVTLVRQGLLPEMALVDLGLPPHPHAPTEGLALITELITACDGIRIVVLSGQNDESNARLARTLGATDFIGKPVSPDVLKKLLLKIADLHASPQAAGDLLGRSPPILQLRLQLKQFADSLFPVLIEGESGTGKELAAKALHTHSARSKHPYLALNCAAIAPTLVEATLFGHGRGAFTGAHTSVAGYFEDARDGTLFLDEIGELPLELQPKLLRVLENGEYQRIGETQPRHSSARIVAATNRDLREEVRAGRFRSDLYHRLSVFAIQMPPLRELGNDHRLLLERFCTDYASQAKSPPPLLSDDAWEKLSSYSFPGNVRELRNIAIRLTSKYAGREVAAHEIEAELDREVSEIQIASPRPNEPSQHRNIKQLSAKETLQTQSNFRLDDELRALEAAYIAAAQEIAGGNISRAARLLGLSRTTLYNRIESLQREHKIDSE